MLNFFLKSIDSVAERSRVQFEGNKSAIEDYVENRVTYAEFVAILRGSYEEPR